MLKQMTESDGDGGFTIASGDLPSWLSTLDGLFSFAFWMYRANDEGDNRFRTPFVLYKDNNNLFGCRFSTTAGAASMRVGGSQDDWRRGGSSGNMVGSVDQWSLVAGYLDGRSTNYSGKIWQIDESETDPTNAFRSIEPANAQPVANMDTGLSLLICRQVGFYGSHLLHGIQGGLVFWKNVQLADADITYMWNQKNPCLWDLPASGNVPARSHDGVYAVTLGAGGNVGERGGSNATGPMVGDAIANPQDIMTYWNETGATDSGDPDVYEPNTTFPASPAQSQTLFNPFREDPE